MQKIFLLYGICLISCALAYSQPATGTKDYNPNTGFITCDSIKAPYIIISEIILGGNDKTKDRIILREIGYKAGDTIPSEILANRLLWVKNRIFNTTLFLWVDLTLSGKDSISKTLTIIVKERFYTYPLPTGDIADRNFNEWWQDRNHDLRRIDYGITLKQKNLWGLNQTLQLKVLTGFNRKLEFTYTIPYIDKKLKTGMIIGGSLIFNPQVAYRTFQHKLDYFEHTTFGRLKYNFSVTFTRRNQFYGLHQLGPYFQYTTIADTIAKLNPEYFLERADYQRSFGIRYSYIHDRRDFIHYPLKGYYLKTELDYQYLVSNKNQDVLSLRAEYTHFIPFTRKVYFAAGARGKVSAPWRQPYFSQRGMGYNKEWVSGYERYVVDGHIYGMIKTNIKYRVFSINPTIHFIPFRKFRTVPLSLYLKLYADIGYVADNTYNPNNNFLSNRLLRGGGIGVDVVTYYDIVGRIEYSVNHLGETGIFLHLKAGI